MGLGYRDARAVAGRCAGRTTVKTAPVPGPLLATETRPRCPSNARKRAAGGRHGSRPAVRDVKHDLVADGVPADLDRTYAGRVPQGVVEEVPEDLRHPVDVDGDLGRPHEPGVGGVVTELAAQVTDVDVHEARRRTSPRPRPRRSGQSARRRAWGARTPLRERRTRSGSASPAGPSTSTSRAATSICRLPKTRAGASPFATARVPTRGRRRRTWTRATSSRG